jgi:2-polyprenyl-3-methyl-5-hydroxy-6-metoxy-1,4-benzoquinol methylase
MKSTIVRSIYHFSAFLALLLGRKRKFMNLGYEGSVTFKINEEDKTNAHHIALYGKLISLAVTANDQNNISALEIGCGRGGGCYVLKKYFGIKDVTGIDLSSANIKLAERSLPEGKFIVSDATEFNTDKKYDLIINLESSHAYSSRLEFFKKVMQHMKDGSDFVFGDHIRSGQLETVENMMKEAGFRIIASETINQQVTDSIKKYSPQHYPLPSKFPFLFPKALHNFAVTIHSSVFKALKNGSIFYKLYHLKKAV